MPRLIKRRGGSPAGTPPGKLTSYPEAQPPVLSVMGYGGDAIEEAERPTVETIREMRGRFPVLWVDVSGLADISLVSEIGEMFGLNPLALEDVINTHQRPKAEEFDDHMFVVLRMVSGGRGPDTEQVTLFFGGDFVLSFQERKGDCFEAIRQRLRQARGRIRREGADYLAYALIDAIVDGFFPGLEKYGEALDRLEDEVTTAPENAHTKNLHAIKRDLLLLRRAIWPTRDLINLLVRDETPFVSDQTRIYLRDAYDHTIQLMDIVETYREIATGLLDVYLSGMSARLNEVMKVLTIIATIFIPLSFLVGLWGMNFDRSSPWNMPELGWAYGYPLSLLFMLAVALALVWYFWRKGWLGDNSPDA